MSVRIDYTSPELLGRYRASDSERARIADLVRLLPRGRHTALEIGARDGFLSRLLTEHFREVTALDLVRPGFEIPGVVPVRGDVTRLDFPDESFDCVVCTEVLEHVPDVTRAASEIARVARHEVIIGVPNRQDTRVGRTLCGRCGRVNPPWGHVNRFDERRLRDLFRGLECAETSYVWETRQATNPISAWLMGLAGHPDGTYNQGGPCIHCGLGLVPPAPPPLSRRAPAAIARRLNQIQSRWVRPWPNWIHLVLRKR